MFMCMPMLSRDVRMGVFPLGTICVIGRFCTRIHTGWKAVDKWHSCCHCFAIMYPTLWDGKEGSFPRWSIGAGLHLGVIT
jgi:hypothetical protein